MLRKILFAIAISFCSAIYADCDRVLVSSDELSKHETMLRENTFVTRRDFSSYMEYFGATFYRFMLGKKVRHWLDLGGGKGNAVREWLRLLPDRKGTNITVSANSDETVNGYRLLVGNVEDIPASEVEPSQAATDAIGAISYSTRPNIILSKMNGWLTADGKGFIQLLRHRWDLNKYQSFVLCADGRVRTIAKWIEERTSLAAVKVTTKEDEGYQLFEDSVEFSATVNPSIPDLELVAFASDAPPQRIFIEKGTSWQLLAKNARRNLSRRMGTLYASHKWLSDPVDTFGEEPGFSSATFKMERQKAEEGSLWYDINDSNAVVSPWQEKLVRRVVQSPEQLAQIPDSARFVTDSKSIILTSEDVGQALNLSLASLQAGGSLYMVQSLKTPRQHFDPLQNTTVIKADGSFVLLYEYLRDFEKENTSWLQADEYPGWRGNSINTPAVQTLRYRVTDPSQRRDMPSLRLLFEVSHKYGAKMHTHRFLMENPKSQNEIH